MSTDVFHEPGYILHNKARLEHLASLGLPLEGRTVLSLGSGIGCHAPFFLERGCKVTVTDGRPENVARMRAEHPDWDVRLFDVEQRRPLTWGITHEIIYCYGLLYHCQYPWSAMWTIAQMKPELLLLETCVAMPGKFSEIQEPSDDPRCSLSGWATRVTREAIHADLRIHFPLVYMPLTQPAHDEFPLDWNDPGIGECRAIFIGSTTELNNPLLTTDLPMIQTRYGVDAIIPP